MFDQLKKDISIKILDTVTSRLFTHIVSSEKSRKEMWDRKDPRGIKHTYYNIFFYIASS